MSFALASCTAATSVEISRVNFTGSKRSCTSHMRTQASATSRAAVRGDGQQELDDLVLELVADAADHAEVEQHDLRRAVVVFADEDVARMRIAVPDAVDADLLEIRLRQHGGELARSRLR